MQKFVAKAAVTAVTLVLATASVAHADTAAPEQSRRVADHFRGDGAWVAMSALGGRDAIDAAQRAGVMLTIFGLAGVAVVARMKFRAVEQTQRANEQIRRHARY